MITGKMHFVMLFLGTVQTQILLRLLQKDFVFFIVILLSPSLSCQRCLMSSTLPSQPHYLSCTFWRCWSQRCSLTHMHGLVYTYSEQTKTLFFWVWKSNYLSINQYLSSSLPVWTCHLNPRVCWQVQYSSTFFMFAPVHALCHVFLLLQSDSIDLEFVTVFSMGIFQGMILK